MLTYERSLWSRGARIVAGIDEAGRGPLAGPVVAAAVVFPSGCFIRGVNDSKMLTPAQREELYTEICCKAAGVGVGVVDHETIDRINILNATFKAMHLAIEKLPIVPDHLLIDGNRFAAEELPTAGIPFTTIVDGDALCFSIAAASIIAKVTRDRIMVDFDSQFPGYGFAQHKGYATREHRDAIFSLGYCSIHRRSFSLKSQLEMEFKDIVE